MKDSNEYENYFSSRNINFDFYKNQPLSPYILKIIKSENPKNILDFGCGYGQTLSEISKIGEYKLIGYDIEPDAITHAKNSGLDIIDGNLTRLTDIKWKFDLIIMSHVLEHMPKSEIISTLNHIKNLLSKNGKLLVVVPNAQSNTGCYWAYEDFTHHTLFTAGSLLYVLRQAGFSNIELIDKDCLLGINIIKRLLRKSGLAIYKAKIKFWNKVTASSFHQPSPVVFSYEIKMLAS